MGILIFLLMNAIVIGSSYLLTYKVFAVANLIDSLITWFIFYLSQIVLTELILGITGMLFLPNVIFLNLVILLCVWFLARNNGSALVFKGVGKTISILFEGKTGLSIIALTGLGAIILCFGMIKISINLFNPPFGWDSLNYHFTFPVEWLKHGNLNSPITVFDDPSPTYYPINGNLFYLWLILPLKNVFLADVGQLPFFILSFFLVYSISRKTGVDKEYSFYAASLFVIIPNFFKQLQIAYVDVMVAALFLAALHYLFLLRKSFDVKNTVLFGLSTGLLIGTKTVALPYSILLFAPFAYLYIKNIKRFSLVIPLIVAVMLSGMFSYIKNFIETGNPLYPLDFKLLGDTIFKGVMDKATYAAHFKIEDYGLDKILFHEGLGLQTVLFTLPAIFLAFPVTLIKKRKSIDFIRGYFLILPLLLYLVYRCIIPLANLRYLYNLLAIGIVLGFYLATILNIPKAPIRIAIIICSLASMFELAKRQELVVSTLVTVPVFFLVLFLRQRINLGIRLDKKMELVFVLLFIIIAGALIFTENIYINMEFSRYVKMVKYSGFWPDAARAWEWLNENTSGNNIAYVGRPVPFPLYGSRLKNNVYYVSVNKIEPSKIHYFKNSYYDWDDDFLNLHKNLEKEGNYRGQADYYVWLRNLVKRNTDSLFVYSLHQTKDIVFPLEDEWARGNPEIFIPVFSNDTIRIYKIIK